MVFIYSSMGRLKLFNLFHFLCAGTLTLSSFSAQAADFFTLDALPPGSFARRVSADGTTVLLQDRLWTPQTGATTLFPRDFAGRGISANGSVVVGYTHDPSTGNQESFRWTEQSGLVSLGLPPSRSIQAYDVSADGSVVVGAFTDVGIGANRPYRWTERTGIEPLAMLPGRVGGFGLSTSADGSVVAGRSWGPAGSGIAGGYRWEEAELVALGGLPDKPFSSTSDLSADGSTVVGWAYETSSLVPPYEAFLWTAETGTVGLGVLPGWENSLARAVSADGKLVLGSNRSDVNLDHELFAWSESTGMVSLTDILLTEVGVELMEGAFVVDISADNHTLVGFTESHTSEGERLLQSWAVVLDEPLQNLLLPRLQGDYNNNGLVEQQDLDLVLTSWGQDGEANVPPTWTNDLPTGNIDQEELDRVLVNWGSATAAASAAAVPEPTTAALLLIGSIAVATLRGSRRGLSLWKRMTTGWT